MSLDFYIIDVGKNTGEEITLFDVNYTHNVTSMWRKAGIYEALYQSDGKQPREIIKLLIKGMRDMEEKKEEYSLLNPLNGWGDYNTALNFLRRVIEACKCYPNAKIKISR